jgi:hypothetical protein
MKFLVLDATGLILRNGSCPDDMLALQAHPGETATEDIWEGTSDIKHKIVAGQRVDYSPPVRAPNLGVENYRALIRRKADKLAAAGLPYDALLLLKTIGG